MYANDQMMYTTQATFGCADRLSQGNFRILIEEPLPPHSTIFSFLAREMSSVKKIETHKLRWDVDGRPLTVTFKAAEGGVAIFRTIEQALASIAQIEDKFPDVDTILPIKKNPPPELTREDNTWINTRAAEMCKGTPRRLLPEIVETIDPRVRQDLKEKKIDPIIYHFRMKATKEFRTQQARALIGMGMPPPSGAIGTSKIPQPNLPLQQANMTAS